MCCFFPFNLQDGFCQRSNRGCQRNFNAAGWRFPYPWCEWAYGKWKAIYYPRLHVWLSGVRRFSWTPHIKTWARISWYMLAILRRRRIGRYSWQTRHGHRCICRLCKEGTRSDQTCLRPSLYGQHQRYSRLTYYFISDCYFIPHLLLICFPPLKLIHVQHD